MKNIILMLLLASSTSQAATHYFVRHAEKDQNNPTNRNPDLTLKGQQRAQNLALMLSKANIKHIHSTAYKRTVQTAHPLAENLNISINHYDPSDMSTFLTQLKSSKENSLVVGHSNTTTEAVSTMTGESMAGLSEDDYGDVFQVIIEKDVILINHFQLPPATAKAALHQDIKIK